MIYLTHLALKRDIHHGSFRCSRNASLGNMDVMRVNFRSLDTLHKYNKRICMALHLRLVCTANRAEKASFSY
jgi:hypothetical protein